MYKKFCLALIAVLLAASLFGGLVSAQEIQHGKTASDLNPRPRGILGQVTEVDSDQFTIESPNGETRTITVTGDTVFRLRVDGEGQEASFKDLQVGTWVAVGSRGKQNEDFAARLVIILPEDFDPEDIHRRRLMGEVDQINNGQSTFDLITRQGDALTLSVDENIRFVGSITELKDLEKGMVVGVLAAAQEDGTLLAKVVGNEKPERERFERAGGRISEIGEASLTITTRQDKPLTFNITEETRFGSRDGSIEGLDDLALEDAVMVLYTPVDEGNPDAAAIMYADEAVLGLERAAGEVQSAGGSQLTLTTLAGETLSFTVDENTRIRGREIEDLNDIKNRMKALVLYNVEEDGILLAKGILVRAEGQPGE